MEGAVISCGSQWQAYLAFFGLGLGPQMGCLYPSYSVNQVPMKSAYGLVQSAKES